MLTVETPGNFLVLCVLINGEDIQCYNTFVCYNTLEEHTNETPQLRISINRLEGEQQSIKQNNFVPNHMFCNGRNNRRWSGSTGLTQRQLLPVANPDRSTTATYSVHRDGMQHSRRRQHDLSSWRTTSFLAIGGPQP